MSHWASLLGEARRPAPFPLNALIEACASNGLIVARLFLGRQFQLAKRMKPDRISKQSGNPKIPEDPVRASNE
jgi:hypothetical protein